MQHKLKIPPTILFSDSSCSRQQTHSLCVSMVSHRSQVHQNVSPNRSLSSLFSLSLSSALGACSGSGIKDNIKYKTKFLALNDVTLSGLAVEHCFKMAATDAEFRASLETNYYFSG